jgi:hypothetical protein
VGVTAAQYDYTPPQRTFNAGGGGGGSSPAKERPTYGLPGHTPGAPQGLSDLASAPPSGYSTPARAAVQQQVASSQIFAPVQQQQQQQRQQSFAAPAAPLQQQRQEEEAYQSQTFRHVRRRLSHFPPSCTLAPSPCHCP